MLTAFPSRTREKRWPRRDPTGSPTLGLRSAGARTTSRANTVAPAGRGLTGRSTMPTDGRTAVSGYICPARDAAWSPGRPARWNIEPVVAGTMEHPAGRKRRRAAASVSLGHHVADVAAVDGQGGEDDRHELHRPPDVAGPVRHRQVVLHDPRGA